MSSDVESSEQGETIGSRLRKRRVANSERTHTSEEPSPSSKRVRRSRTPAAREVAEYASKSPSASRARRTRLSEVIRVQQESDKAVADGVKHSGYAAAASGTSPKPRSPPDKSREVEGQARRPLDTLPLIEQFREILTRFPTQQLGPDSETSLLQDIIKHGEKVDQYERWGKNVETDGLPTMGAELELKIKALPVLANITAQLLHIFATYTYLNLVTIVAEPDSDAGKVTAQT